MGKSCGITTEAFLDSYEISTMIADDDAVEGLKMTIEDFIDVKLEELGDVPGSRSLIMNGLITSMNKLSESGELLPKQALTGANIATAYMSAKPEPVDPSSDNDNNSTEEDLVVNDVASISTNIESTIIPEGTKAKDYPPFIESGVKKVSMRVFYNLYFKGRGKFVKGFTAFTNSHVREILMGTTLGEDEDIASISGPTADMSAKYNVLKEKLRIASAGIAEKTKEEIQQKFDENDQDFINSYYAYVMLANLEFMIEHIAEGNTVTRDRDVKGTKDKDKKYVNPAPKVTIKKSFSNSFKLFANENLDELSFNLDESTLEEKKSFVKRMTVDDTVKDGDSEVKYTPFVKFEGVPPGYNTKRFNVDYPGLLMEDDSRKINSIKKGDIFMSKVDPETGKRLLVRASPEYIITYNLNDKAKRGHEEDFNGFDNDVSFIKFLLKSTTRLLAPNADGIFTQDPDKPFLSDVDFYKISTELSNIEDRTFDGIRRFLKNKVREGATSDDSANVIYRSIYQAYFADGKDKIYSYFPVGRKSAIKLVSLGEASRLKKFQFASKTGAPNMISALVQFLSKESNGRLYFKDGVLEEFSAAETASIEIGLPDSILNSMISDGKLTNNVKANIYGIVKGSTIEVNIDYGDENSESLKISVYKDAHNNIKFVPERKITDHDEIAKIFKSLNFPPKLQDPKFIAKLVSATTVSTEDNNISGKRISDIIGAVASMGILKDADFGKEIDDTNNKKLIEVKDEVVNNTSQGILRPYISEMAKIYEEVWGIGAPNYGINAEGNKYARYTNSSREGQMLHIRKQMRNPYSVYGIENYIQNDDIYRGNAIEDGLVSGTYSVYEKDGIERGMELYTNQSMTPRMRASQAIDGGFFSKLAGYEHNTFYIQPMVYSDRSAINMYKFTLSSDIDLFEMSGNYTDDKFLSDDNPGTWNILKQNYVKSFRGKYDNMQYNVYRAWSEFLLSDDIATFLATEEGKKSGVDLAAVRALGYKMAKSTRGELLGTNAFKGLTKEIAKLGIPVDVALKSKHLSKGITVSSTETGGIRGFLSKHSKVAIPTTNASLMVEYLYDDANAIKFVNENIKNSIHTFKHDDIDYKEFTEETKEGMTKVFGKELPFDEGIAIYHLITAPLSDSIIDTLMSPDTEYGNNNFSSELSMSGKSLTSSNFLQMLEERTKNFVKQSKRVQSMGSKGIRPRVLRSEGYYRKNLPKNDLYFGPSDEQMRIVSEAPVNDRFKLAVNTGIFTSIKDKVVFDEEIPITIAGSINFIKYVGEGTWEFVGERTNSEQHDDPELFDNIITLINSLEIGMPTTLDESLIGTYGVDFDYNLSEQNNIFYNVQDKLLNDDGEIGLGIEDTTKNILIDEDDMVGKAHLLGSLGITDTQDSLDGVQWAHPLYFLKLNGSLGEEFSSFSTNGAGVKDLSQSVDRRTGILKLQKKSTQNIFTNEILGTVGNKKLHNIFKKMNTSVKFPPGFSVQIPEFNNGVRTGIFKTKFFKNANDIGKYVNRLAADNNIAFEELIYEMIPEWDTLQTMNPTGTVMAVDGKMQEFNNLHELWENQGSYYKEDSWENVAKILANNPKIRNNYIEKLGFNSAQKTGNNSLNKGNVLLDENYPAEEIATYDMDNESHIVMLQKEHDYDSSDGADHPSKLALPSQFMSALNFDGKTMLQALNSLKGVSFITDNNIRMFYMNMAKALKNEKDLEFLALEDEIILPDGKAVKFSSLNFSEITLEAIAAFDTMLNKPSNKWFKDKMYKKMALDKIKSQIREDRDSVVVLSLANKDVDEVSFNSLILREKAVNVFRSAVHKDIISIKLPGVIAITAPSDFMASMETTSQGRMGRMDAIKFTFESTDYNDIKNIHKVSTIEELVAADLIPTDKVRVTKQDGTHYYQHAGLVKNFDGITSVEYVEFQPRNERIHEEYAINVDEYARSPLLDAGVTPADMNGHAAKDIAMSLISDQFIGKKSGDAKISSTEKYMNAWGDKANTGKYTSSDVVMISGSGPWRSKDENKIKSQINATFRDHYRPLMDKAIDAGASFVFGNAKGTDAIIMKYLQGKGFIITANPAGYFHAVNPDAKDTPKLNKMRVRGIVDTYNSAATDMSLNEYVNHILNSDMNGEDPSKGINKIEKLPYSVLKTLPVYSDKGVNVMRQQGTSKHFGNPATGSGVKGLIQFNSGDRKADVQAAAAFYKNWLKGEQDPNYKGDITTVEPQQREWILKQIKEGKLKGQKLLYMTTANSYTQATGENNYYSHANALSEFIKEIEDADNAAAEKSLDDKFKEEVSVFDTYKKKKSPELRLIVDRYREAKAPFQKATNRPTKITGRDWVEDIHTGEVMPSFYARKLYGDLSMFKLYTRTDTDLNWYKNGLRIPPVYTGVFVDKNALLKRFEPVYGKTFGGHMTIGFGAQADLSNINIGEKKDLKVVGRLLTPTVDVLVLESTDGKEHAHITLSTNGVSPVASNQAIIDYKEKGVGEYTALEESVSGTYGYFSKEGKTVLKESESTTPFEDTEIFQRNYILNKNLDLYKKLYNPAPGTDFDKVKQRTIGEMQTFMEENDIQVTMPEAYAPNFFMKAFDMTVDDKVTDVIGFSEVYKDQEEHATAYFRRKMYGDLKFSINEMTSITPDNVQERLRKYKKLLLKENNGSKIETYKVIVKTIEAELALTGGVVTVTTGKEMTKKVNSAIKKENKKQININARKRARSFIHALEVMPPRIPGQGKQSGAVMRIKAFIHSNKNAFYGPREFYLNSGEDNDIDTNNVITRAIDENGYEYDYTSFLLIPEEITNKEGYKKKYAKTMHDFPIMLPDGTNPKLDKILQDLEVTIRKEIEVFNNATEEGNKISEDEADNIVAKKLKAKMKSFEKAVQNYVIDNMKSIMASPRNMIELETPISMDRLSKSIEKTNDGGNYNYNKHGVNTFNSAWLMVLEELNMQGKTGIASYANGQRTLSAIQAVQSEQGRNLAIGNPFYSDKSGHGNMVDENGNLYDNVTGFTVTISRVQRKKDGSPMVDENGNVIRKEVKVTRKTYANTSEIDLEKAPYESLDHLDTLSSKERKEALEASETLNKSYDKANFDGQYKAWETLSQLLSAATDNAKALILGKIGANNDTNTLISTMIIMGFELNDVTDFLGDPKMKQVFKEFMAVRNNFEMANLKAFLGSKIARKKASPFEMTLYQLLKAGDEMSKFRKVLTFAQDNKIETRDLYKALGAIYSSDLESHEQEDFIKGVVTEMSSSEVYTKRENLDYDDKKPVSANNRLYEVSTTIFNPLFFIQNHPHAKSILKGINTAETAISSISPIDKIISDMIKKNREVLPYKQHEKLEKYINNLIITEYFNDKKAYLPIKGEQVNLDLSKTKDKERLVYTIHESVSFVRDQLKKNGISNVFLNSIEFMKSKEDKLKTIIGVPSLMEEGDSEHIVIEMAIQELMELDDPKLRGMATNLLDSLFKYSLITGKGKDSRHSMVSVFENEYIKFSDELSKVDFEGKMDNFINGEYFKTALALSLDQYDSMVILPVEKKVKTVDDQHQTTIMTLKHDRALSTKLSVGKKAKGIVKIIHPNLKDYSYYIMTIKDPAGEQVEMPIKIFKTANTEALPMNTKDVVENWSRGVNIEESFKLAGYTLGLEANLPGGKKGKILAYMGKGKYLVKNSTGNTEIVYDSVLETLNPKLVFFGNDFRKATEYDMKLEERSFRTFDFTKEGKKTNRNNEIRTSSSGIVISKSDGSSYKDNNTKARQDIIDFIFDPNNTSSIAQDLRIELSKEADKINQYVVMGMGEKGSEVDIQLWMKLSDTNVIGKRILEQGALRTDTWGENFSGTIELPTIELSTIVRKYMTDRTMDMERYEETLKTFKKILKGVSRRSFNSTPSLSIQYNMNEINKVFKNSVEGPFELQDSDLRYITKCRG